MEINEMRTFLGKRVRVILDNGDNLGVCDNDSKLHPKWQEWQQCSDLCKNWVSKEDKRPVIVTGQLLAFGDGGDFEILEDDGFVRYCWPLLDMEEVEDEPISEG